MKYDDLEAFRTYMESRVANENTRRTYYSAVVKLFRNVGIETDITKLNLTFYEKRIPEVFKTKNTVSAVKNGLKYFQEYILTKNGAIGCGEQFPEEDFFREVSRKKRNRSVKPKKVLYLNEIKRKVNQMKDKKAKYAFRLALVSGLRVSELAALDADKITFQDGKMFVEVTNGKGGSNGIVECMPDSYLAERLPRYLAEHPEERLFYTETTLRKKAWKLGLECHDFRRIFAQEKRNELKKQMSVEDANALVQQSLRHKRFSTTKRYLFNRKLFIGKKRSVEK